MPADAIDLKKRVRTLLQFDEFVNKQSVIRTGIRLKSQSFLREADTFPGNHRVPGFTSFGNGLNNKSRPALMRRERLPRRRLNDDTTD